MCCFTVYLYESNNSLRGITSIHQPTVAHIISHKTLLKHFKILGHVSILSDHHHWSFVPCLSYVTVFTIQFVFANEVLWQHIVLCRNVLWGGG